MGLYAKINYLNDYNSENLNQKTEWINSLKVQVACGLIIEKSTTESKNIPYSVANVHKAIKEFCGQDISGELKLSEARDAAVKYDKKNNQYSYEDEVAPFTKCININNIVFKDGCYEVDFTYCYKAQYDYITDELYETTMRFKLNENYEYTKYCLIDVDNITSTKIEEEENNNETNQNITNTTTTNTQTNNNTTSTNSTTTSNTNTTPTNGVTEVQRQENWGYDIVLYSNNEVKITLSSDKEKFGGYGLTADKTCNVIGFNGKVKKMFQTNEGTSTNPVTLFIMENGTIQYIQPLETIANNNIIIPSEFIVDKKVENLTNAVDIKENEYGVVIAITSDGKEVKIMNEWFEEQAKDYAEQNTKDCLNKLKIHLGNMHNNKDCDLVISEYENKTNTLGDAKLLKQVQKGTAILSSFIGKINDHVTNIESTTIFTEDEGVSKSYINLKIVERASSGNETNIIWKVENENKILMKWYDEETQCSYLYTIDLDVNGGEILRDLMK